jgi:uncharacterized protein GlcG (DUF336 family)
MIRVSIDRMPGASMMTVTAEFEPGFSAMPRDVQTREIERVLSRANELSASVLATEQPVTVPG